MFDDDLFTYVPEVEEVRERYLYLIYRYNVLCNSQTYSEWETEEAMKFIKENDLPMSDMFYALKYVRISNRAVELDEQFQQIQDRLDKLRQEDIRMVSPPSGGDWDPKLNK